MNGILIEYAYSGDETLWQEAIDEFIDAIKNDSNLEGKFKYIVTVKEDKKNRLHMARWSDQATLEYLQSQPFFKDFAGKIKEFAGDTLNTTKITQANFVE